MGRYIYARYFYARRDGDTESPVPVVVAAVNVFEATETRQSHGDYAVFIGAVHPDDVPAEWSGGPIVPNEALNRVLAWGSKLPQVAGEALFPYITTRHPVRWRD